MQNSQLIRDDEHAKVEIDLRWSVLRLTWKGFVPSKEFRRILIQAHMQVVQYKVRFWLSDSRRMAAIMRDDEQWIQTVWIPRIFNAGLERLAIVPGQDYFYQMTTKRLVEGNVPRSPFPAQLFEKPEEAMRWLLEARNAVA